MVVPAVPDLCPQCGADIRTSGTRCKSCGFWLPASPAPRTGPPAARPVRERDTPPRNVLWVLIIGGLVVVGLGVSGAVVWLRQASESPATLRVGSVTPSPVPSISPARLEPSSVLPEARKLASTWRADAVLISIGASPLTEKGVAPDGSVDLVYAQPSGPQITAGADAAPERFVVKSSGGTTTTHEERGGKGYAVPEPNCLFEDALMAAQRAGLDSAPGLGLRYRWSARQGRPVWEAVRSDGVVLRTLDGVSCSILSQ